MHNKIISISITLALVSSLGIACYACLAPKEFDFKNLAFFIPTGLLFILHFIFNATWGDIGHIGIKLITEMDPITIAFLSGAFLLVIISLALNDKRFEQVTSFAFNLALFIAGFEAGKLRQKRQNRVESHRDN